jgi:hypothetical protein
VSPEGAIEAIAELVLSPLRGYRSKFELSWGLRAKLLSVTAARLETRAGRVEMSDLIVPILVTVLLVVFLGVAYVLILRAAKKSPPQERGTGPNNYVS